MAHTITPANIFGDFCACVEEALQVLTDSLVARAADAVRNQLPKQRTLSRYPGIKLPEPQLDFVFDELVKIEEGIQASILNKIPKSAGTAAGVFLQCLQDQINALVCDFLDEFDPTGLIKGYGDLWSDVSFGVVNLKVDFTAQLDIFGSICGGDTSPFQATVDSAFADANFLVSGNWDVTSATSGIISGSYKTTFDNSVQCVQNMFDVRNNIEDHVILF